MSSTDPEPAPGRRRQPCDFEPWLRRSRLVIGHGTCARTRLERMTLFKVVVRDRQQAEENKRIDDVQHAETASIATAEMGNRGRHQRDREASVPQLLQLERNSWNHERK